LTYVFTAGRTTYEETHTRSELLIVVDTGRHERGH